MPRICAAISALLLASCSSTDRARGNPDGTGPFPGLRAPDFCIEAVEQGAPHLSLQTAILQRPVVLVFGTYS